MSDEVNQILEYINKKQDVNRESLNKCLAGQRTDTGKDYSDYLYGIESAYASLRHFIEQAILKTISQIPAHATQGRGFGDV